MVHNGQAGRLGKRVRERRTLENFSGGGLCAQMGVVDKSGHFLTARGLDAAQRRERLFKVVRLGTVGVDDEQEVKILRVQLVNEARQHMRADGVAADVDDARPALVLKQRQDRRVDRGHIHRAAAGADDHADARLAQALGLLIGAEIGVYDVKVGQRQLFVRSREAQRQIDGIFGLARAVVAGDDLQTSHTM